MLEALARFNSRYAKIILAVWVVAMLVIVPTAIKSFDSTEFSFNGTVSESSEGQEILEKHFHSTGIESNPVLVLSFDTPEAQKQFKVDDDHKNVVEFILDWFKSSPEWYDKLERTGGIYVLSYSQKDDSSLVAIGFTYRDGMSSNSVMEDTPNLRSAVNESISEYLSYIAVPTKQFNSYVTGNSAILYDSRGEVMNTLTLAVVVVLIIAIVLMGLFFGSAMTSVVSVVSIVSAALVNMFVIKLLTSAIMVPTVVWLISMFLTVAMSFAFCVLFISTYRRQVLEGVDKDEALSYTFVRATRLFLVSSLCVLVGGIVFLAYESTIIRPFGLCLITTMLSVLFVSMVIPISMISVTKNELFWTRNPDGSYKYKTVEDFSPHIDKTFTKISYFSDKFSSKGCLAIIIAISLIAVGSAAFVAVKDVDTDSYDLTDSLITGESAAGFRDLEAHSMGGTFQPYNVVLKCDSSIGEIVEVDPGEITAHREIIWNEKATETYKEVQKLRASIVACDPDNIHDTTSFVMWDEMVKVAKEKVGSDPKDILQSIRSTLVVTNIIASQGLEEELAAISPLFPPEYMAEYIVNNCGPRLDYAMNHWLSDIGSDRIDGKITIDYISVTVFTKTTCTSYNVIGITDKIDSTVSSFIKDSNTFSKSWVTGVGISYRDIFNEFSNGYFMLILIVLIVVLLVLYVAERDVIVPLAIMVSTLISTCISTAIVVAALMFANGTVSHYALMITPIFALTFSLWFGYMQIAMMRNCGSISEMKKSFNPVIIVSSLVIALSSLLMMFSDVDYISQTGFAVAVMVLVDAFIVRMLFSPAVWKVGIDHKAKFFQKYSKE